MTYPEPYKDWSTKEKLKDLKVNQMLLSALVVVNFLLDLMR